MDFDWLYGRAPFWSPKDEEEFFRYLARRMSEYGDRYDPVKARVFLALEMRDWVGEYLLGKGLDPDYADTMTLALERLGGQDAPAVRQLFVYNK